MVIYNGRNETITIKQTQVLRKSLPFQHFRITPPMKHEDSGVFPVKKIVLGGGGFASGNAPGLRRSFGISKVPPFSAKSCGVTSGELRLPMVIPGPG